MKQIPVGKSAVAFVDNEDFELVSQYNWTLLKAHKNFYATTKGGRLYLHRLILQDAEEVDHKNGNGLDCRRQNLRVSTHSQNMANRGKNANNTSGYKGVNWCKTTGKWRAKIQVCYRYICLGRYDTVKEAGAAYRQAAQQYFGEFAKA